MPSRWRKCAFWGGGGCLLWAMVAGAELASEAGQSQATPMRGDLIIFINQRSLNPEAFRQLLAQYQAQFLKAYDPLGLMLIRVSSPHLTELQQIPRIEVSPS